MSASNTEVSATGGNDDDHEKEIRATCAVYTQVKPVLATGLRAGEASGRTGRWTDDETEFVDHMVNLFDQGELPIPNGTKLGTFLGDILLCRTSRLTKKMKKAKLGARTFALKSQNGGQFSSPKDHQFLSMLQEGFIKSMPEDYSQVEIRFNLARQWRTYFLELCLQAGYNHVLAEDWIASLDKFDELASAAKEQMRALERRTMQKSFNSNSSGGSGNYVSSLVSSSSIASSITTKTSSVVSVDNAILQVESQKRMLEPEDSQIGLDLDDLIEPSPKRSRSGSEDIDTLIGYMENETDEGIYGVSGGKGDPSEKEVEEVYNQIPQPISSEPKTFSDAVSYFMESMDLPFDYADVWVPAGVANGVRLLPAGHATRRDQLCASALDNFGEYSQKFSFEVGSGLPGRVYNAAETRWEFKICDSDPCIFMRAEGAKTCGIKTAVGIPFSTPGMGKMIVVFYSRRELTPDSSLAAVLYSALSRYSPKPKWQLVIEKGNRDEKKALAATATPVSGPATASTSEGTTADMEQNAGDATSETVTTIVGVLSDQLSSNLDSTGDDFASQMLQLRLFLLRSSSSMSHEDTGIVSILTSSFQHYSKDNKRSPSAIAKLLTQEWSALRATQVQNETSSPETYRRHILDSRMARALLVPSKGVRLPGLSRRLPPNSKPSDPSLVVFKHPEPSPDFGSSSFKASAPFHYNIVEPLERSRRTVSLEYMNGSSLTTETANVSATENSARDVSPVPTAYPVDMLPPLDSFLQQEG